MAANPSMEMVAYELGYMKDDMTLEQLEQVFGQFDVECSRASGEKRSGKVSSCGNGLNQDARLRSLLTRRDGSLVSLLITGVKWVVIF